MTSPTKKFPELGRMQESAEVLKGVFRLASTLCIPGIKTQEINKSIYDYIISSGASPVFLGYHGFPGTICISINDEVVHGIPGERVLHDGDVVSIDCGVSLNSAITDACRTFIIGSTALVIEKMFIKAQEALDNAIEKAVVGNTIGDISYTIQRTAELCGYNVPRELTGHAVGYQLHQPPWIFCHGTAGSGEQIEEGMFLAIEPILIMGHWEVILLEDGWTVVTKDGSKAIHVEDTIYVGKDGPVILTRDV